MPTRKQIISQVGLLTATYTAGYLTPIGRTAASFVAKCIPVLQSPQATGDPVPDRIPILPPPHRSLEALKTRVIYDDAGNTVIVGLVRNSAIDSASPWAEAHVYNGGDLIGHEADYIDAILAPGGTFPFRIAFSSMIPRTAKSS